MECDGTLCVAAHASCVSTHRLRRVCTHKPLCVFVRACVSVIEKKIGYDVVVDTHMEAWLWYMAVDGWQRAQCSNCSLPSSTQQPLSHFSHLFFFSAVFSFSPFCSLYVFYLQNGVLSWLQRTPPHPPTPCLVSGCNKIHRKPQWKSFISTFIPFLLCSEWRPVVQRGSQKKQPHFQLQNAGQPSQREPGGVARARAPAAEIWDHAVFCRFWAQVHQGGRWRYVRRDRTYYFITIVIARDISSC